MLTPVEQIAAATWARMALARHLSVRLKEKLGGCSNMTIWRLRRDGTLPKPKKLLIAYESQLGTGLRIVRNQEEAWEQERHSGR